MTENLTAAEAAILAWARKEIARLKRAPDSDTASLLLIGTPEPTMMIVHEIEDHCPGIGTVDEAVYLDGEPALSIYTNRVL